MGRAACLGATTGLLFGLALSAGASAQAKATPRHALLPPVPQLQLSWPVRPLGYSFSLAEQLGGFGRGPVQLFRLESLWLRLSGLSLFSAYGNERATELDCRLTCAPIVKPVLDLEARVPLPALSPALPHNRAFVRWSHFRTSSGPRFTGQLTTGLAGALNF